MTRQVLKQNLKEFMDEIFAGFMQAEGKHAQDSVADDMTDWATLDWPARLDHYHKQVEQAKLNPSAKAFRDVAGDAFIMWYYYEHVKKAEDAKEERRRRLKEASGGGRK